MMGRKMRQEDGAGVKVRGEGWLDGGKGGAFSHPIPRRFDPDSGPIPRGSTWFRTCFTTKHHSKTKGLPDSTCNRIPLL